MLIVLEPATTSGPTLLLARDIGRGDWGWLGHVLVGTVPLSAKQVGQMVTLIMFSESTCPRP